MKRKSPIILSLDDAIRNCTMAIKGRGGFTYYYRFFQNQIKLYTRNTLFKNMAMCQSGIYFDFISDGCEISLDCARLQLADSVLPSVFTMSMEEIRCNLKSLVSQYQQEAPIIKYTDHLCLHIEDGQHFIKPPVNGKVTFEFDNPDNKQLKMRLYMPVFPFTAIKNLATNGTFISADVERKAFMLCLGDSITQGFNAEDPSTTYVIRLQEALNANALNQGIGGYYYESQALVDLEKLVERPRLVTVAYGTNDWSCIPTLDQLRLNVRSYYERLLELYPDVPIVVFTPWWRGDIDEPKSMGSFSDMTEALIASIPKAENITILPGLDIPSHDRSYLQDNWLHPNAEGFKVFAQAMLPVIRKAIGRDYL
ncbi:MAG: SGNH/GDSL hydrolase family protein [Sphaerochaetaceae bacterium]|jgi:lysophospholipase L1-like esterase|nr:SGNH/GDSL hydrolase family protein [Sphaerochaetaceae bacterium]